MVSKLCGTSYLDKLAVAPEAKGSNVGKTLLDSVSATYPTILWRAKTDNPVNTWYTRCSDGHIESDRWIVYWKGLSKEAAAVLVRAVISLPETFMKRPSIKREDELKKNRCET